MSLVGLTGAHGTGKSTILRGAKKYGVNVIESSLSRSAQAMLGWENLKPAEESEENMWALQEMILNAMYDRDYSVLGTHQFTLVDRTPADVWAYVDMWSTKLEAKGVKLDKERQQLFKNRCRAMAQRYSYHIVVPISEDVPFIAERSRADLDTRDYHEKAVCQFVVAGGLNHVVLMQSGIEQRVAKVASLINNLEQNLRRFQQL